MDVAGDVNISSKSLSIIPIKFRSIGGYFYCDMNCLTSLEGCPVRVGGKFSCLDNELVDSELFLYGCTPEQIRQYYVGKNLNEQLLVELSEEAGVGIKKKKI